MAEQLLTDQELQTKPEAAKAAPGSGSDYFWKGVQPDDEIIGRILAKGLTTFSSGDSVNAVLIYATQKCVKDGQAMKLNKGYIFNVSSGTGLTVVKELFKKQAGQAVRVTLLAAEDGQYGKKTYGFDPISVPTPEQIDRAAQVSFNELKVINKKRVVFDTTTEWYIDEPDHPDAFEDDLLDDDITF